MVMTFISIILSVKESGLEVAGTRPTLGSEFLKKSLQGGKMGILSFLAPECTVNAGCRG